MQALEAKRINYAPHSGCAINAAVAVLGDPWAILVLRDIMFGNRRHFRELVAFTSFVRQYQQALQSRTTPSCSETCPYVWLGAAFET